MLLPCYVFGQDTLITTKGVVVPCKVTVIAPNYITYTDSLGTFTIPIDQVFDKKINGHPFIAEPKTVEVYKEINLAGGELQRASRVFYGGAVLMILGAGLSVTGATLNKTENPNLSKAIMYSGFALSGVGFVVNISSFSAIANAGRHLSKVKPE